MDAAPRKPASETVEETRRARPRPDVVKLGGSVIAGNRLQGWLEIITNAKQPIVIVPGGGTFADRVRACQRRLGFDDATAHRMALLAMDQLAWAVAGLRTGFEVGTSEAELCDIVRRGHVAIWAPSALIGGRTDMEATWRVTSDSLALWVAGRLNANACYLIKSVSFVRKKRSATALVQAGVVDDALPAMLNDMRVSCAIFGQGDEEVLASCFSRRSSPEELRIEPAP